MLGHIGRASLRTRAFTRRTGGTSKPPRRFAPARWLLVAVCVLTALAAVRDSHEAESAATLPPGFVEDILAAGFDLPTSVAMLPDGRMLITEKAGLIKVFKDGKVLPTPFADLRFEVGNYWDRGLTNIAVDPNFATNGFLYLVYTYDADGLDTSAPSTGRITRLHAVGDVMEPGSETIILGTVVGPGCTTISGDCIPQDWYGHTVDMIQFMPDGTMLVSIGETSTWEYAQDNSLRAQDVNQYPGKILRINASGQGLPSNPFWDGNPNSVRSRVYAYGLRNPFRLALDPTTNVAWVGDVGWDAYDEISPVVPGANYGWPCYEGTLPQPGYQSKPLCQTLYAAGPSAVAMPMINMPHSGIGASVVQGGFTPATSSFPAQYKGGFFYADYAQNWIRFASVSGSTVTSTAGFATGASAPVDLKFGLDGNLYYISIGAGQLRRIRAVAVGPDTYLSDLSPTAQSNGWGPYERDTSNGESAAGDGRMITINGAQFFKGIGAHAASDIAFAVPATCTAFSAQVGIDDEIGSGGGVVFEVWNGTTTRLYQSPLKTAADAATTVLVPLNGVTSIRIVEVPGDSAASDHGDWADAKFICTGTGGGSDTTAPAITAVAPSYDASGVTISWTTDEAADSQVDYGPTLAYGFNTTLDTTPGTSHSQLITGVPAGTTYNFRVKSRDAAGNLATSGNYTFGIPAGGTVYLSDLAATSATNGWGPYERDRSNGEQGAADGRALTINGTTFAKGLGVHAESDLRFAVPAGCTSFTAKVGIDDEVAAGSGSVTFEVWNGTATRLAQSAALTGSDAAATLTVSLTNVTVLRLVAAGGATITSDHGDWADAKLTCGAADGTPPALSGIGATAGANSAVVNWLTDENSNSQVEYGLTTSYGSSTTLDATMVTTHAQTLTGLQANATYHYRVKSQDATGNLATSGDMQFSTAVDQVAPTISGVGATATASGATVIWTTNEASSSQVEYGLTTSYGNSTTLDGAQLTSHSQIIGGLATGVQYHYRVKSRDAAGNLATSADGVFTTINDATAPSLTSIVATPGTSGANITWTTNEPADTQVEYGLTTTYGASTTLLADKITSHNQGIAGLAANTTYHYRVKSRDAAGNLATSTDRTFRTNTSGTTSIYLSDLPTTGTPTNAWGPFERDRSNGEQGAADGRTLTIQGTTYTKGIGAHAASDLRWAVPSGCTTFTAQVGIDDEVGNNGSLNFEVWNGTSTRLYNSPAKTGAQSATAVSVSLNGVSTLRLVQVAGSSNNSDHGDWGDAKFTCASSGANSPPVPTIASPASTLLFKVGDTINLSGSATDVQDGPLAPARLTWQVNLQHCPGGQCHTHPFTTVTGATASFVAPDHGDDSYFDIVLTATDSSGLTASKTVTVRPQTVQLRLDTVPSGLQLVYGSAFVTTPFTATAIIGGTRSIEAPATSGTSTFGSWSDGGAAAHTITVPSTNLTLTATYVAPADASAPALTAIGATPGTTSAVVTWTSDEASDTQVEYGLVSPAYGSSTTLNTAKVTSHTQALTGLAPATTYHYRVKSRDAAGNLTTSLDQQFTTTGGTVAGTTAYSAGTNPHGVHVADLDGDGDADLAVANAGSSSVSILLGNGAGGFATAVNYATGAEPKTVASADFNGDGKLDLVTANQGSSTVSVLLGSGTGTFAAAVDYPAASNSHEAAIGDFNGDSREDIVVAGWGSSNVAVLLGNGNGTFQTRTFVVADGEPHSVVAVDLNGDGKLDLAVANRASNDVSVFLGAGNGTFATKVDYATGASPHSIRSGDLNGDSRPDLVTANDAGDSVSVLINSGTGTFAAKVDYTMGNTPKAVVLADVNSDGKLDVLTANINDNYPSLVNPGGDSVSIRLGNGNGTFATKVDKAVGQGPFQLGVGRFNSGTGADLVTANWWDGAVTVRLDFYP